jgi:hypothetical protein
MTIRFFGKTAVKKKEKNGKTLSFRRTPSGQVK